MQKQPKVLILVLVNRVLGVKAAMFQPFRVQGMGASR